MSHSTGFVINVKQCPMILGNFTFSSTRQPGQPGHAKKTHLGLALFARSMRLFVCRVATPCRVGHSDITQKGECTMNAKTSSASASASSASTSQVSTIASFLQLYGLTRSGNCSSHKDNGRLTSGNFQTASVTQAGKVFFGNRDLDKQAQLISAMKANNGKAFSIPVGDGKMAEFIPVPKGSGRKLPHAPKNPGSWASGPVRAWFALMVKAHF